MASNERGSTANMILNTLIANPEPLNLYNIAKQSKLSHQRVSYTLPKLIAQGLIIPIQNGNSVVYSLQDIHIDKEKIKKLLNSVTPLMRKIYLELRLDNAEDNEQALANNVAFFIEKQILNIK